MEDDISSQMEDDLNFSQIQDDHIFWSKVYVNSIIYFYESLELNLK